MPLVPPLLDFVVVAGVVVPPPLEEPPLLAEGAPAVAAVFCSEAATATPMPMSPFMPACACPLTVQRNSYFPLLEIVTVSVVLSPCLRIFVVLPEHALVAASALATGFVQTRKLWNATPMFVTLKVIVPAATIDVFESLNASSDGLPAVTVMTVVLAALTAADFVCAAGASPVTRAATRPTAANAPRAGTEKRKGKRLIESPRDGVKGKAPCLAQLGASSVSRRTRPASPRQGRGKAG